MGQFRVLQVPIYVNLRPFLFFLYKQKISCLITEEGGCQVIWVKQKDKIDSIFLYYGGWQFGLLEFTDFKLKKDSFVSLLSKLFYRAFHTKHPMTWFFVFICLVIACLTGLGNALTSVSYLTYVPIDVVIKFANNYIRFYPLSTVFEEKEYWRLITPIFLHFGWMHLAFNIMWLVDIGRRIEIRCGAFHLAGLIISTGLLSNYAQYYYGGKTEIFGGFSGVVYGLLGYCMARTVVDKRMQFGILPAVYIVMCVFLLLGYTDLLTHLFGHVANAAHMSGLVSGLVFGGIMGFIFRK